jgi:hypothetical protein
MKLNFDHIVTSCGLQFTDRSSLEKFKNEFFFHTKFSGFPFLLFDLEYVMFVKKISISNRSTNAACISRANGLKVSIGTDISSLAELNLIDADDFLELDIDVNANVRFIAISLNKPGILHFKSIELLGVGGINLDCSDSNVICSQFGFFKKKIFHLTNSAGFFSNCSVLLHELSLVHPLCEYVDTRNSFTEYKDFDKDIDNFDVYFKRHDLSLINDTENKKIDISFFQSSLKHHSNYLDIDFEAAKFLVDFYFSPSERVLSIINKFIEKYSFDFENTICVCFRGTDKWTEVAPASAQEYLDAVNVIIKNHPDMRVWIQTDQYQFRKFMELNLPGRAFFIDEMPVTDTQTVIHSLIKEGERINFAIKLLAVTVLMSKCSRLITHTGNVAYWSVLYRGSFNGVVQF